MKKNKNHKFFLIKSDEQELKNIFSIYVDTVY